MMGKLYKLRKAILKDPKPWRRARGAYFYKGKAKPSWYYNSYRNFIKSVLDEITNRVGLTDDGHGDE